MSKLTHKAATAALSDLTRAVAQFTVLEDSVNEMTDAGEKESIQDTLAEARRYVTDAVDWISAIAEGEKR
ncbi:hypothetical protein [Acinetobacter sp. ANC 3813]|uniref:hypothetical protein n=1 Tax=Acinetobacter sp. ANC 3813 TaxID=1977873 RepID=UPI000A357A75|nr:hypothetical protein [Acinetobacter sp. ANC 3813]OTG87922.1 hypothetical protein B9T34_16445 [Acinetobacter sp. ANC 3813]